MFEVFQDQMARAIVIITVATGALFILAGIGVWKLLELWDATLHKNLDEHADEAIAIVVSDDLTQIVPLQRRYVVGGQR